VIYFCLFTSFVADN